MRQGNLILDDIASLPDNVRRIEDKTLWYGSAARDSHSFARHANVRIYIDPQSRVPEKYLEVLDKSTLFTLYGQPLEIPAGTYHVWMAGDE